MRGLLLFCALAIAVPAEALRRSPPPRAPPTPPPAPVELLGGLVIKSGFLYLRGTNYYDDRDYSLCYFSLSAKKATPCTSDNRIAVQYVNGTALKAPLPPPPASTKEAKGRLNVQLFEKDEDEEEETVVKTTDSFGLQMLGYDDGKWVILEPTGGRKSKGITRETVISLLVVTGFIATAMLALAALYHGATTRDPRSIFRRVYTKLEGVVDVGLLDEEEEGAFGEELGHVAEAEYTSAPSAPLDRQPFPTRDADEM